MRSPITINPRWRLVPPMPVPINSIRHGRLASPLTLIVRTKIGTVVGCET